MAQSVRERDRQYLGEDVLILKVDKRLGKFLKCRKLRTLNTKMMLAIAVIFIVVSSAFSGTLVQEYCMQTRRLLCSVLLQLL